MFFSYQVVSMKGRWAHMRLSHLNPSQADIAPGLTAFLSESSHPGPVLPICPTLLNQRSVRMLQQHLEAASIWDNFIIH